jgi:hypothetical protein
VISSSAFHEIESAKQLAVGGGLMPVDGRREESLTFQVLDTIWFTDYSYLCRISRAALLQSVKYTPIHVKSIVVSEYLCIHARALLVTSAAAKVIFRLNDENEMMTTQMHITVYLSQYTTVTLWREGVNSVASDLIRG